MQIPLALLLLVFMASPMEGIEWLVELPARIFHGYTSLVRWGADSIQTLFEKYGYWVVFLGTLSENTLLVGLVVPGAIVVVLAGLAAHDGSLSLPVAIVLGVLGTVIGDTISYWLGRLGWARFGSAFGGLSEFREKVREPILRRGLFFVLVYHFAGYTRVVGPAGAGMLRMPFGKWAPADYGGASLWVTAYMGAGYLLGVAGLTLDSTDRWFKVLEYGLLVVVALWGLYVLRAGQRTFAAISGPEDNDILQGPEPVGAAPIVPGDPTRG